MCPLAAFYDCYIHDALANMLHLDGSLPVHPNYGPSVNFIAQKEPASTRSGQALLFGVLFILTIIFIMPIIFTIVLYILLIILLCIGVA
jgi:hypothetical protein